MSRTDHNTRNLLLHLQPGHDVSADAVNTLILPLGMQVRCFRKAALSNAPFMHLDPRTCARPDALR